MMEKIYDISGKWQFQMDEAMQGETLGYANQEFRDFIRLPGTTALAKKGKKNTKKETGYLTELYPYLGYAWYSKVIEIEEEEIGKTAILSLERSRITTVFVDGVSAGTCNSLTTTHRFDLTKLIHKKSFRLTVMVSNTDYPTGGGHLTSPDTQTNWNGILGKMELVFHETVYIKQVRIDTDIEKKTLQASCQFVNTQKTAQAVTPMLSAKDLVYKKQKATVKSKACQKLVIPPGEMTQILTIELGNDAALWDEYTPHLYELTIELQETREKTKVVTGLRKFQRSSHHFLINGQKIFLRGKHDALVFPQTGAAPMEVEEWLRVMTIAKEYGINHYRFHTCCPPEAAFEAADLLGIYMEPELPFWGTLAAPGEEGYHEAEQEYLTEEGFRILAEYGNHPSFCMMSLGNELWGSTERMAKILRGYQAEDDRHFYTQGSNNFQFCPVLLPEDDFWVGVRLETTVDAVNHRLIRGSNAACDAPMGHIQLEEPSTIHNYDGAIVPKEVQKDDLLPEVPVVVHEAGQYAVYPDFSEIKKYKGPLRARNMEVFRERIEKKGMLEEARDFFWNSGKLSAACYKEEIECFLRSEHLAGFQLLDLQDYPGQGTALVGILNAFMENKGYCSKADWREFCSDLVILAEFNSYIYEAGQTFSAKLKLSNYRYNRPISKGEITYQFVTTQQEIWASGKIVITAEGVGLLPVAEIKIEFPEVTTPQAITLSLAYYRKDRTVPENTNHYTLWLYPKNEEIPQQVKQKKIEAENGTTAYLTTKAKEAEKLLARGERVLYFPTKGKDSLKGTYCTDFWCYPMFRSISENMGKEPPVGTMGLSIQKEHPALKEFPSKSYTTPQWYSIVTHAECMPLETFVLEGDSPIVQMIDNFERNHKLGILFEGKVNQGRLLVCTSQILEQTSHPEVRQFLKSLFHYVISDSFSPRFDIIFEKMLTND